MMRQQTLLERSQRHYPHSVINNIALLGLSIASLLCCGCSSGQLETYPTKGKVKFKSGAPVHVGTVELKSREHGVQARGDIQPDGTFELSTYSKGDGAVAGTHDCVVVQFVMTEELAGFKPSAVVSSILATHPIPRPDCRLRYCQSLPTNC